MMTVGIPVTQGEGAGAGRDAPPVALWHTVLPLDPARKPVSLRLPDDPRREVVALSSRNGSG